MAMDDLLQTIMRTRGAVTAVAAALNISPAAVSQWRIRGEVPAARVEAVSAALTQHMAELGGPVAQQPAHSTEAA